MKAVPRGFTLIEMLLVISIIVLLMALLVPQIGAVIRGVRFTDTQRRIAALHTAVEDYHRAYGAYPPSTSPPTPNSGGRARWDYVRYRYPDGTEADDLFGVLVESRYGRNKIVFPLSDLTAVKKKKPNYQPVQDYCVWFANK